MTDLDTIIIKMAAPCNLACTYCYEYFTGDDSWKKKPKHFTEELASVLGSRIYEHANITGRKSFNIVAHGGEPLLLGPKKLDAVFSAIRENMMDVVANFSLQTNATLINQDICEVLVKHNVLIGVSIDGDKHHNSRRIDHVGASTFDRAISGINQIKKTKGSKFGGVLCVVNIENSPEEVIEFLCDLNPPSIDLLQPFLSHDSAGILRKKISEKFGNWMVRAMNKWLSNPNWENIRIRVLEDALKSIITEKPTTDWFGPRGLRYLIVETDGSYDLLDQLKAVGSTSIFTRAVGASILDCSLQEAAGKSQKLLTEYKADCLPDGCKECRWEKICAGGHLPSRYSVKNSFNNRSVYCEGIQTLLYAAEARVKKFTSDSSNGR